MLSNCNYIIIILGTLVGNSLGKAEVQMLEEVDVFKNKNKRRQIVAEIENIT